MMGWLEDKKAAEERKRPKPKPKKKAPKKGKK